MYFPTNHGTLTSSRHYPIDLLVECIPSVPGEGVLEKGIGLEGFLQDHAFHGHPEVDEGEVFWDGGGGHLDQDEGHVAQGLAAVVHQVHLGSRQVQALLQDLQCKV